MLDEMRPKQEYGFEDGTTLAFTSFILLKPRSRRETRVTRKSSWQNDKRKFWPKLRTYSD